MDFVKINLGCGSQVIDGWINVDYSLGAHFMKIPLFRALNRKLKLFALDWSPSIVLHNITKKFPWDDKSVDVIYSSHALEHLTKEQGADCLMECHRVLKKGGVIRIVVPDLAVVVNDYTSGNLAGSDFLETLGCVYTPSKSLKNILWPSQQIPHLHKCMYDQKSLIAIMDTLGFEVQPQSAFDSAIKDIRLIELESRCKNALIIEGKKR